jgi:hypothetical protein
VKIIRIAAVSLLLAACQKQHHDIPAANASLLSNRIRCSQVGEQWFRRRAGDEGWTVSPSLIAISPEHESIRGPWFAYNERLDTCLCAYATHKIQNTAGLQEAVTRCWMWDTLKLSTVRLPRAYRRQSLTAV